MSFWWISGWIFSHYDGFLTFWWISGWILCHSGGFRKVDFSLEKDFWRRIFLKVDFLEMDFFEGGFL